MDELIAGEEVMKIMVWRERPTTPPLFHVGCEGICSGVESANQILKAMGIYEMIRQTKSRGALYSMAHQNTAQNRFARICVKGELMGELWE